MKQLISSLEIADYRTFLTYYDRRHIRKIEAAGPDIASVLPTLCKEISCIGRPYTVLLSVDIPSTEYLTYNDLVSLLGCVTGGNNNPNIC